jgi:predicted ATPase/class 3 adenylate cyclase
VAAPARAPDGTIALLFTDIEGSTRLATELGPEWPEVLATHHEIVASAITDRGGFIDGTEGDAFFATFTDAAAAARAAVAAQQALHGHAWPALVGEIKVRMGLHVAYVERASTGYVGLEVHRAARVAAAAHGGQLLITEPARVLAGGAITTEPLGAHRMKDFPAPELIHCAVIDGRGAAAFPPPRTEQVRPNNLPAGTLPLIGREAELDSIRDAFQVEHERLVTITGRGGAGKTSLALAAAADMLDDHSGGVWLVRLARLSSPAEVLPAAAAAIGAEADGGTSTLDAVAVRTVTRGMTLIVLDNFEHVLGAAPSLTELLERAPELRLLVTSQAPLRLGDERRVNLDALDERAALELIERVARRRSGQLALTDTDREALLDVIALLDGLPLALELAAARLAVLTPAQLRDRLQSSSEVLRDDRPDRPHRQRSLRATVDWTLELLDQEPRALFVRFGAFAGPVELEELEAVAGADGLDVVEALASLLDVALVRRVESGDGRVRFGLPEALRQIAAAMLAAAPDGERWRSEHVRRQYEQLWSSRQLLVPESALDAMHATGQEAALAVEWARASRDPRAPALAAVTAWLLAAGGHAREALALLDPLLESPPDDPEVSAEAELAHGVVLSTFGRIEEAFAAADRAARLATEPPTQARTLIQRGVDHLRCGRVEAAVADSERATAIARGLGPIALSYALAWESQARMDAGQLDVAAQQLEEAKRIAAATNATVLWKLYTLDADLAMLTGRPQEACESYALSLEAAQQRGYELQIWWDLCGLGDALAVCGSDGEALEVAGIGEAHIADMGATEPAAVWHLQGHDWLAEAAGRLGPAVASGWRDRGRAVDRGYRVTRACQLARAGVVSTSG